MVQAYSSALRNAFTKFSLPVVKQNSTVNELQTKRIKQFHKSRRGMPALKKAKRLEEAIKNTSVQSARPNKVRKQGLDFISQAEDQEYTRFY